MIVKNFSVDGLFKRDDLKYDIDLNNDINILTGINGSGKTTILKLIWYFVSGNIERITSDITFNKLHIGTDKFSISLRFPKNIPKLPSKKSKKRKRKFEQGGIKAEQDRIEVKWDFGGDEINEKDFGIDEYENEGIARFLNQKVLELSDTSIFFPTFRRIEGGFTINKPKRREKANSFDEAMRIMQRGRVYTELDKAFYYLSDFLSVEKHRFVTSISVDDISNILTRHYADISEKTNSIHKTLSTFIAERTKFAQDCNDSEQIRGLEIALEEIQKEVSRVNSEIDSLLNPFTVIGQHINTLFRYKGIQITDSLILGENENGDDVISSDKLSAGEKQLLSFLCYNAFYNNTIFFIDEPELSLHVDWQRLLVDILMEQNTTNQFIIATHSPFIYSQYPEKEIMIDENKGDNYLSL